MHNHHFSTALPNAVLLDFMLMPCVCVQAAAAARVAGKGSIHDSAHLACVQDHLIADAGCINSCGYNTLP
jgi:hypothetical protein